MLSGRDRLHGVREREPSALVTGNRAEQNNDEFRIRNREIAT